MYYLIYTSYAVVKFQEVDLKELLVQAQEKNKRLNITGMLYYFDGIFIQLIEGSEADVKLLGATIAKDPRHKDFAIVKEGPTENRFFKNWSMGFKSVSPTDADEVKYFKEMNTAGNNHNTSVRHLFKIMLDK